MSVIKPIKGFVGTLVLTTIGGEAIRQVGNIGSGMSSGLKGATQSLIGIGVAGHTAKLTGVTKVFKWR